VTGAEDLLLLRVELRLRQGTSVKEFLELHQVAIGVLGRRVGRSRARRRRRIR
jgi:hypothetical protein